MSIIANNIFKDIGTPPSHVLKDINLEIGDGEFIALTGRSGSGKSTLLYLLSTLDAPTKGSISISGHNVGEMPVEELYQFRNRNMGFVFQFHYLISELTALENVLLPTRKFNLTSQFKNHAEELLASVGLSDKMHRLPRQLSGGEQQRVAIARSLVMKPKYLFADEPTGSLDTVNGDIVMDLIHKANMELSSTVVMVTHDPDFAKSAHRQIHLIDGEVKK